MQSEPVGKTVLFDVGLALQPQHFQMLQRQICDGLATERKMSRPHAWGVAECVIADQELASADQRALRFDRLRVILPDGLEVSGSMAVRIPDDVFPDTSNGKACVVYLAVAPHRPNKPNVTADANDASCRYVVRTEKGVCDENDGGRPRDIRVRTVNPRLVFAAVPEWVAVGDQIPLIRLKLDAAGAVSVDNSFFPPLFVMDGCPPLRRRLAKLAAVVHDARQRALGHLTRNKFEFHALASLSQVEHVLRLQATSRGLGRLAPMASAPNMTPFDVYLELRTLAADLEALRPGDRWSPVAEYDHNDLSGTFASMLGRVEELLVPKEPVDVQRIEFRFADDGSTAVAPLSADHFARAPKFYLAVESADPTDEGISRLAQWICNRDQFHVSAPDDFRRQIRGIRLVDLHSPPAHLSTGNRATAYFELTRDDGSPQGPWNAIESAAKMVLWARSGTQLRPVIGRINAAQLIVEYNRTG